MTYNALKMGWRVLRKRKLFSFVNIAGLAVSLACGLLILFHVQEEIGFETGFPKADRIYRLQTDSQYGTNFRRWGVAAPALGPRLQAAFPEIESAVRLFPVGPHILSTTEALAIPRRFEEQGVFLSDPAVVSVFDLRFLAGDPVRALAEPRSIVLSASLAGKYFGSENALGRTIQSETGRTPLVVTGVMADLPRNTHLQVEALISMATFGDLRGNPENLNNKTWKAVFTYLLLGPGQRGEALEAKLPAFMRSYFADMPNRNETLHLQPIRRIHLHSKLEGEIGANSDVVYVYVFSGAALLLLLIAGANFVNLSTAQSLRRMKEVGVRKVIGARRSQIVKQHLQESMLVTGLAAALSMVLLRLALPFYNRLGGKASRFAEVFTPGNAALFAGLILLFCLLAGLYPALFVSGFKPVNTLKSARDPRSSASRLRKGLVVFQFAISIFMIFCTLTISRQLSFFHRQGPGFDKSNTIAVKIYGQASDREASRAAVLKAEILRHPAIRGAARTSDLFGQSFSNERLTPTTWTDKSMPPILRFLRVDEDFIRTAGLRLVEGRDFDSVSDAGSAFIINEAARAILNLAEPLGLPCRGDGRTGTAPIVGVIRDFHFASLHSAIEPLVLQYRPAEANYLIVNADRSRMPQVLDFLKTTMGAVQPSWLFQYDFVDQVFDRNYAAEDRGFRLFRLFSALSLGVAGLGLFGLAVFAMETRVREIGIRKALGASGSQVALLLSRPFLQWTGAANLIALPLGFAVMKTWLAGFAFRVSIPAWTFVAAAAAASLLTILTVGLWASRAAAANPAGILRQE